MRQDYVLADTPLTKEQVLYRLYRKGDTRAIRFFQRRLASRESHRQRWNEEHPEQECNIEIYEDSPIRR